MKLLRIGMIRNFARDWEYGDVTIRGCNNYLSFAHIITSFHHVVGIVHVLLSLPYMHMSHILHTTHLATAIAAKTELLCSSTIHKVYFDDVI